MKPKGRAFISSAYSGGTISEIELNVSKARVAVEDVLRAGWVPICPNVFWHPFAEFQDYRFWLEAAISLMETCDILVLVPGWELSSGVASEIRRAKEIGILILTLEELKSGVLVGRGSKAAS
jgi:hypothetical protein